MIYAFNQAGNWFTKYKQNGKPHDEYMKKIDLHLLNQTKMIELQEKQVKLMELKDR